MLESLAEPSGPSRLRADRVATARRIAALRAYMDANALGPAGFCCASYEACRNSIREGDRFFEGQLSHVGHHYDLRLDQRPLRVVVVGQEYAVRSPGRGSKQGEVSLDERYTMIHDGSGLSRRYYTDGAHPARNPHMRGTTSALRVLFGKAPGADWDEEFIQTPEGDRFHIFDAFALVNVLLCSAGPEGLATGRSTKLMRSTCLRHFAASMEILEPTIMVLQGHGVQRWIAPVLGSMEEHTPHLSEARLAGSRILVCRFSHPAAHPPLGWGNRVDASYLRQVVEPTLRLATSLLYTLSISTDLGRGAHSRGSDQPRPRSPSRSAPAPHCFPRRSMR